MDRLLAWGVVATAGFTFVLLWFLSAPYGRHARAGWGRTLSGPRAWLLMEAPASLLFAAVYFLGEHRLATGSLVLFAMWQAHYAHRAFVYPFRVPESSRTPLVLVASGIAFNTVNAWLNARQISTNLYSADWLLDARFAGGAALFVVGRTTALRADAELIRLRRENPLPPKGEGSAREAPTYAIPHQGLFRWVSCPNYLGEILEWCGWAIATWSLAGAAFAAFTAANLVPRARSHHRWYRERFADYPRTRRALVPFFW
jgi:hypothetical protein